MKKRRFLGLIVMLVIAACALSAVACDNGAKVHTVTFTGEGVTTFTQSVSDGGKAIEPKDPVRSGYTFGGWYLGDEKYDFSQSVTKDLTLVAHWSGGSQNPAATKYTVKFMVEGVEYDSKEVEKNGTVTPPATAPKTDSKGGAFIGWYYGDTEWNFSTPITSNITLTAKFAVNPADVSALGSAKLTMDFNYTAAYYFGSSLSYKMLATYNAVIYDYNDYDLTYGFKFIDFLAYRFTYNEQGVAEVEDEPYGGALTPLEQAEVLYTYYPASNIYSEDFTRTAENEYTCKADALAELSELLTGSDDAESITVTLSKGEFSKIRVSNFTNAGGIKTSLEIRFTDVGKTSAIIESPDADSIWAYIPEDNNPEYRNDAPSYFGDDPVKPVDRYVIADNSVNGPNDDALPELKTAIENARYGIGYQFTDYFDDYYNYGKSDREPSSRNFRFEYSGYRLHVMRSYDEYTTTIPTLSDFSNQAEDFYVVSGGQTYFVIDGSERIYYRESSRAFGVMDNIFTKLNASMFESTSTDGVYEVKASYRSAASAIVYNYAARDPYKNKYSGGFYERSTPDNVTVDYIRLTARNGNILSLEAKRTLVFKGETRNDSQYVYYTVYAYEPEVLMPNEVEEELFTPDQQELHAALTKTGYNYTMRLKWHDGYERVDYYGDRLIYREYVGNTTNVDGYIYVNDYAYWFTKTSTGWDIDELIDKTPHTWGSQVYYRAYMNAAYLPLSKFDAHDFYKDEDGNFVLKSSAISKYRGWEFGFEEEGGMLGLTIILTEAGYIDRVVCGSYDGSGSGDTASSTAYFYDIGTTEYGKQK